MPRCKVVELDYCTSRGSSAEVVDALAEARAERAKLVVLIKTCGSLEYLADLRAAMENNMDVPVRVYVVDDINDRGKVLMAELCYEAVQ